MNADELAEVAALLKEQSEPELGWVAQFRAWRKRVRAWLNRLLANVLAIAAICAVGGLALNLLGVPGRLILQGLVLAGPVIAAGLVVFVRWAVGQNFIAPSVASDVTDAEPASQDDLASEPAQPVASHPTVTVTVHSLPANYVPIRLHSTPEQIVADYAARHPAIASAWKDDLDGDD